jgi:hypothetical protein
LVSANEIPAGGEGQISVSVHLGTQPGPLQKSVRVQTNVPNKESFDLILTANAIVDIEVQPALLRFEEKQTTTQVTLKNHTNGPVELHDVVSPSEYVKITLSATTLPVAGEVVVTAELLPDIPSGVLSGWVVMQTNLRTMPELQIRVWGNIVK